MLVICSESKSKFVNFKKFCSFFNVFYCRIQIFLLCRMFWKPTLVFFAIFLTLLVDFKTLLIQTLRYDSDASPPTCFKLGIALFSNQKLLTQPIFIKEGFLNHFYIFLE